jgi:hypothetical protein
MLHGLPPAPLAHTGKGITGTVPDLAPLGMQDIGVDLKRPRHFCEAPISSHRTAARFNSLVNCR